jgi:dTDP-4-dehydrorhamnose reductase
MKILGTGLTGLIGSRITELLSPAYSFENVSRSTGVDITNRDQVKRAIFNSECDVVLHLAAFTNVREAELEKDKGEASEAWKINVAGTENIVAACNESGKKLIYASTDLVFDGEDTPDDGYNEDDKENPLNWYAKTKYEGELRVRGADSPWIVIRPAYPFRATYEKNDFVRLFIQKLDKNESLTLLTDRIITPTFIDDLAPAIDLLLSKEATGIYHTVGSTILSIYDAAEEIADIFGFDKKLLLKTTRKEFLVNRPPEPFNSALNNAKIRKLGATMHTFSEGVQLVKSQRAKQ